MKKLLLLPILILWAVFGYSQSNIFPATGSVGIGTITPEVNSIFHINGAHGNTGMLLQLPASANGNNTGDIFLKTWVSEPQISWEGTGIGTNINNLGLKRYNNTLGSAYIRFIPNTVSGMILFSTIGGTGTKYDNVLAIVDDKVGIGTTNPSTKLEVVGDSKITGNLFTLGQVRGNDLVSAGTNSWIFHTPDDGRKNMFIAPGIGADGASGWDWSKSVILDNNGQVQIQGNLSILDKFSLNAAGNSFLNGGNVGIGITTPSEKLEVAGNMTVKQVANANLLIEGTGASSYSGGALLLKSGDVQANDKYNQTSIVTDRGTTGTAMFSVQRRLNNAYFGQLADYSDINGWNLYTALDRNAAVTSPKFSINPNGNIGVGTATPDANSIFHIKGAHGTTGTLLQLPASANGNNTGDIFLKTWVSEPLVSWEGTGIGANINNVGMKRYNNTLGSAYIRFIPNPTSGFILFSTIAGNGTKYDNAMVIVDDRVGIGTNTPSAKLEVTGDTKIGGNLLTVGQIRGNDLVGTGTNSWIFHTPDDGRKNMFIAPGIGTDGSSGWDWSKSVMIDNTGEMRVQGNLGVGLAPTIAIPSNYKLAVGGDIIAERVVVKLQTAWPDFVFKKSYGLRPLSEVESFINQNNHLPEVPSAEEVADKGIDVGAMNAKLLQKVEELTLYLIEMKKENEAIKARLQKVEANK